MALPPPLAAAFKETEKICHKFYLCCKVKCSKIINTDC